MPFIKLGMSGELQRKKTAHSWSHQGVLRMPTKFTEHRWQWMLCVRGGNTFPHPVTFSFRQIALNWTIYIHIFFPVSNVFVCWFASSFCVCAGQRCERTNDYFIVFHSTQYDIRYMTVCWMNCIRSSGCWLLNEMLSRNYIYNWN